MTNKIVGRVQYVIHDNKICYNLTYKLKIFKFSGIADSVKKLNNFINQKKDKLKNHQIFLILEKIKIFQKIL